MTLLEMMIASAVGTVLVLAMAQMGVNSKRVQVSLMISNEFDQFTSLVSMTLRNPMICTPNVVTNLASRTFNTSGVSLTSPVIIPINQLKYPDGTVIGAPGSSISPGLTLTSMSLRVVQQMTIGTSYLANIRISAVKSSGMFLGTDKISKDIPILIQTHITTGSTVQIDGCSVAACSAGSLPVYYLHQAQGLNGSCGWSTSPYYCGASVNSDPMSLFSPSCWLNQSTYGTCTFGAGGTCPAWVTAGGDIRIGVCP